MYALRAESRNPQRSSCIFAFYSPTLKHVFNLPETRVCDFTVHCKKCGENIPAPVGTMPDSWIVAQMPVMWGDQALPSVRNLSRQTVLQTRVQKVAFGGAVMGEMKRAIAREQAAWSENVQDEKRMKSTIVIAAAIIAAVRLARDPDISRPSPRLTAVVNESVNLARMILDRVGR